MTDTRDLQTRIEQLRKSTSAELTNLVPATGKGEGHCRMCGRLTYIGLEPEQHDGNCQSHVLKRVQTELDAILASLPPETSAGETR